MRKNMIGMMLVVLAGIMSFATSSFAWGGVLHVAPNHPNSMDNGDGSADRPYQTLSYAMKQLMPGDTLKISPGEYREALIFPRRAWSTKQPTTIMGEGNGEVLILGNVLVKGWVRQHDDIYVKRPWIIEPQQVMLKDNLLEQVGGTIFKGYPTTSGHELASLHASQGGIWPKRLDVSRDDMPLESFFYDKDRMELVVRSKDNSIESKGADISMIPFLVRGENVTGITIKNICFRNSNTTTTSRQGAITLVGQGNTLDTLIVEDMDGVGIEVSGDSNVVRNCRVIRSGYLGIKARGRNVLIENNEVSYNNTRYFNKWWEAGGMKFVGGGGLQGSKVINNRVHHNFGDGIWFDWGNDNNLIERNITAYNEGMGIQYEASSRATIQDNQAFGNSQRGIYLVHSRDSLVAHNLIAFNDLEGVAIIDEQRGDPKGILNLRPRANKVLANIFAWNRGLAVILPGVEYVNVSEANFYIFEKEPPMFSMGWPKLFLDKKSLDRWRSELSQDRLSQVMEVPMPTSLRGKLKDGELSIDWSDIEAVKDKFQVSVVDLQTLLPVHTTLGNRVGPR